MGAAAGPPAECAYIVNGSVSVRTNTMEVMPFSFRAGNRLFANCVLGGDRPNR